MQDLRIVFLGTPRFAVASLDALLKAGASVVGVVTAPDKPAGRGKKMQPPAVKEFALQHDLPLLQPHNLKDHAFLDALRQWHPDLQVVVAFRMLPEAVWNLPPLGTINVHASLLPQYRGAAPINRAIMNGENETGVTTFQLQHEIDTGSLLKQKKISILPEDNAGTLHDRLMLEGAELLVQTISEIATGTIKKQPQVIDNIKSLQTAPKIFKDDCKINFQTTTARVVNHIRGLSPYPAAFTELNGRRVKIFSAEATKESPSAPPGTLETDQKDYVRIAALDGWVYLKELQMEGRKKMNVAEFLRGFRLTGQDGT